MNEKVDEFSPDVPDAISAEVKAAQPVLDLLKEHYKVAKSPSSDTRWFASDKARGVRISVSTMYWTHRPPGRLKHLGVSAVEVKEVGFSINCSVEIKIDGKMQKGMANEDLMYCTTESFEQVQVWVSNTLGDYSHIQKLPPPRIFEKDSIIKMEDYPHRRSYLDYAGVFRRLDFFLTAKVIGIGVIGKDNRIDSSEKDISNPEADIWFLIEGEAANKESSSTCAILVKPIEDGTLVWYPLLRSGGSATRIDRGFNKRRFKYDFDTMTKSDERLVLAAIDWWTTNANVSG